MNKEKLNEMLDMEEDEFQQKDIDKKIKKQMRKQIYSRVIIILVILAVVWQGVHHGTSFLLDYINYKPLSENTIVISTEQSDPEGFHVLMGTYVNMYFPGKLYVGNNYKEEGFGRYEVTAKIQDIMNPLYMDGTSNVTLDIHRSHLIVDTNEDHVLTRILNEYYDENASEEYKTYFNDDWKSLINDVKELPDSTILDVSLSFQHTYTLEETIAFINQYEDSDFVWIATNVVNQIAEGMSLYDAELYELKNEAQYPNFYLGLEGYTAEDLKQNYLSKLRMLKDHPEFLELLQTWAGADISIENLEERYDNIEKNGLLAIGLRGYVKKQDFLKMFENNQLRYACIHDVKLSSLQK